MSKPLVSTLAIAGIGAVIYFSMASNDSNYLTSSDSWNDELGLYESAPFEKLETNSPESLASAVKANYRVLRDMVLTESGGDSNKNNLGLERSEINNGLKKHLLFSANETAVSLEPSNERYLSWGNYLSKTSAQMYLETSTSPNTKGYVGY